MCESTMPEFRNNLLEQSERTTSRMEISSAAHQLCKFAGAGNEFPCGQAANPSPAPAGSNEHQHYTYSSTSCVRSQLMHHL